MCKDCNKNSCSGGCKKSGSGKELASLKNMVSELASNLAQVAKDTAFLKKGHPIMMLQNAEDIAAFSFDSGLGSGDTWEGWAICNGGTYQNSRTGKDFQVPNLLNRFPVAAGDDYDVDDTGGLNAVVLTIPQLPVHDHGVTDPGHTHDVTDPGHSHGASSGAHTHTITSTPHTHIAEGVDNHTHDTESYDGRVENNDGLGDLTPVARPGGTRTSTPAGAHTHIIGNATSSSTASSTSVGVSVATAFVGITETETENTGLTVNEVGNNDEHENRPPFY